MSIPMTIITGSSLGNAEYVAESLEPVLCMQGMSPEVQHGLSVDDIPSSALWLIVCSTHGAGELPENLAPWLEAISEAKPDLSYLSFGAIGLGSRDYDLFCGAIHSIVATLTQLGATQLGETLLIDALEPELPEEVALVWLDEWLSVLKSSNIYAS